MRKMTSVLIDQCIISDGDILTGERRNGVIGYVRKEPPKENWKREQFECLPTISELAETGKIELFRYLELDFEDWKRVGSFPSNKLGKLFEPKKMKRVSAAIERSYFLQSSLETHLEKSRVMEFCRWLNTPNLEDKILRSKAADKLPEQMKCNITQLERYRVLCKNLSESQRIDAFHFWSAEIAGIDYFLTTDKKFVNAMRITNKVESSCSLVFPSELSNILNCGERSKFKYETGVFYGIAGNRLYV